MKVGSTLYNRLFGEVQEISTEEAAKAEERIACVRELVSRVGFRSELLEWLAAEIRAARIHPGPHEDMLYRTGYRDGLEHVMDYLNLLQKTARENYDAV